LLNTNKQNVFQVAVHSLSPHQLVAAIGRRQLRSPQTLLRASFLVALLVTAIGRFLSLDHVCRTLFRSTFADRISVER